MTIGMSALHGGNHKSAVGGRGHLRNLIGARGTDLLAINDRPFGIELGDITIGAAQPRLPAADRTAHLPAVIDVAGSIDRDGKGCIIGHRIELVQPGLRAVLRVFGDKTIGAAADGVFRQRPGGASGDDNAARGIERERIAGRRRLAAEQALPLNIARGIVFGEIDVLIALFDLAAETACRVADDIDVAIGIDHGGLRCRCSAVGCDGVVECGLLRARKIAELDEAARLIGYRRPSPYCPQDRSRAAQRPPKTQSSPNLWH